MIGTSRMMKWIIFILAVLLSSTPTEADTLTTPFALSLSSSSAVDLLGSLSSFQSPSGTFQTALPDQSITTPYAVSITGISLSMSYAFAEPTAGATLNEWSLQSTSISSDITVSLINATQTLVEQSGGTTLTLQVNATCTDVHLQLAPGSTQMSAQVTLSLNNGVPSFTLSRFSASWTPQAWQIVSMNCQGPAGFTQLVQQDITTQLQSINPFLPAIQQQVQSQLSSLASNTLSWTLQSSGISGISIKLDPQNLLFPASGGVYLDGQAGISFSNLQSSTCQTQITGTMPTGPENVNDTLILPLTVIPALVQCLYLNGSIAYTWTSQNFPAFQSLLGNWFLKLFVWPDLENFNSKSVFTFGAYPTAEPEIQNLTANDSGDFQFDLTSPFLVATFAPETGGDQHYVDLATTLSGPAKITLTNGVVKFEQTSNSPKLSPTWDALFVESHHPDTSIWTSEIASYLKSYLSDTGLSVTLPTLSVPGQFSMGLGSASQDGTNFDISLTINKLTLPTQ